MDTLHTLISELYEAGRHPEKTIAASLKETGKPAIGMFPLIVPEELIYAAGYLPIGLWGGLSGFQLADKYLQSFCCSIIRSNMELAMMGKYDFMKAIFVPSNCDTLKCVCENMKMVMKSPIIGVTIPNNRTVSGAHPQMMAEFDYLNGELLKLDSNAVPMDFDKAFAVYEDYRQTMMAFVNMVPKYLHTISPKIRHYLIKAAYFMDKKSYTAKMKQLLAELKTQPEEHFEGTRFVATGIMIDAEPVLELLEDLNIAIVDDLLCHESIQFRTPTRTEGSAMDKLCYRILDLQACSPLYEPNKPRGILLGDMVKKWEADAVLFCLTKFCDPDAFDQPLVRNDLADLGIKMLSIEMDQRVDSTHQLRTRIQGFLEMNML